MAENTSSPSAILPFIETYEDNIIVIRSEMQERRKGAAETRLLVKDGETISSCQQCATFNGSADSHCKVERS